MIVNDSWFIRHFSLLSITCYVFWLNTLISQHQELVTNIYERKTITIIKLNSNEYHVDSEEILQYSIKYLPCFLTKFRLN